MSTVDKRAGCIEYALHPSRSHQRRFYRLRPVYNGLADAYLLIQQGEVGPRGGTSKIDAEGYLLQEDLPDPDDPPLPYRVFMLAKDDPSDPNVYEVAVPLFPGGSSYCTCMGFKMGFICRHCEFAMHAVKVHHWHNDAAYLLAGLETLR